MSASLLRKIEIVNYMTYERQEYELCFYGCPEHVQSNMYETFYFNWIRHHSWYNIRNARGFCCQFSEVQSTAMLAIHARGNACSKTENDTFLII